MKIKLLLLCFLLQNIFALGQKPFSEQHSFFYDKAKTYKGFIKNVGQIKDENNKTVNSVLYTLQLNNQNFYITENGVSLIFSRLKKIKKEPLTSTHIKRAEKDSLELCSYEIERTDIKLVNGKIKKENIELVKDSESPLINFYSDTYTDAGSKLYLNKEVLIKNVYDGIDWRFYIKNTDSGTILKYDFIVHPYANAKKIKLRYSNNALLTESEDEGLFIKTKMGSISEHKPFSYLNETSEAVSSKFSLFKNTVSFELGEYDKTKTLVIDPDVFWATYLSSTDITGFHKLVTGADVRTDASGNIFVLLYAGSGVPFITINPGGGAYYQDFTATPNGGIILMKFLPGGQLVWSTYFSGVTQTVARKMTIDVNGNIYITGAFNDLYSPIPLINNGGYFDAVPKRNFIAKFTNNGLLTWCSYFTNFSTVVTDMTSDNFGNIFVTGYSEVFDFPVVNPGNGAYCVTNAQHGAEAVFFISQFNAANQLVWSTRIEGDDDDDLGTRVHADRAGNVYVAGGGRSLNYPLVNAGGFFDPTPYPTMFSKFNANRQMVWSTYFNGSFPNKDITTDKDNNMYLASGTWIRKYNPATQLVWEKQLNTTAMHWFKDIEYDSANDQLYSLGIMNDWYFTVPTQNTTCNNSFFNDGQPPRNFNNITGPIFVTFNTNGGFSYISLTDWEYEYYDESEMNVAPNGDIIYLFNNNQNSNLYPNPYLTNPGNGAYFNPLAASNQGRSALLMKLTPSLLNVTSQVTPPLNCSCNGTVTLSVQCGTAPFQYQWNTGAVTANLTNVCPGNYWVKITDAANLTKTLYFNVPLPPGSTTSCTKSIIPENCNKSNGSIKITAVQGGVAPFSYAIDGGISSGNNLLVGLDSGQHIIKITDNNGCNFYDTVTVGRIQAPFKIFFSSENSGCITPDGTIKVDSIHGGVGPYSYKLNNQSSNSGIFSNLSPAIYNLLVTDTAGCSTNTQVEIKQSIPPSNIQFITSNDHCSQKIGAITTNVVTGGTPPFAFSINNSPFIYTTAITGLSAGNYTLAVKDGKGCVLTYPTNILLVNESGPLSASLLIDQAKCSVSKGSITITNVQANTPPYSYSIDAGNYTTNNNLQNINSGNHLLHIKDNYGCTFDTAFTISTTTPAVVALLPKDTVVCYNDNVTFSIKTLSGVLQNILWNIPSSGVSANFSATASKKIVIQATDINGCIIIDSTYLTAKDCNTPDKCLAIPNAFTPNSDGINDQFAIKAQGCLISTFLFTIYNRYGEVVFESRDILNKWNGEYKGEKCPGGGYTYVCIYSGADNVRRLLKGSFVLIR